MFTVLETLVVPVDKPGALIYLDIHTAEPMEVEAFFQRDFQLEWPAVLRDLGTIQLPSWIPSCCKSQGGAFSKISIRS
jgi:hypothetical protein